MLLLLYIWLERGLSMQTQVMDELVLLWREYAIWKASPSLEFSSQ